MKIDFKKFIIIVTLVVISAIIIAILINVINKNKKIIICIDARTRWL